MITQTKNTIHLQGKNISYIMVVSEYGDLLHYHFGKKLAVKEYFVPLRGEAWTPYSEGKYSLDDTMQEYPSYGYLDLKTPAYAVTNKDNNAVSQLKFKSVEIKDEVPELCGMPHILKGDKTAQTAYITLEDKIAEFSVVLSYTVFDEYDVVIRNVKIINNSSKAITVNRAYSACLELPQGDYDAIYFEGAWARERNYQRCAVKDNIKIDISNARGGSGHNMNPFIMVCDKNADENVGEVYGMSLIYSGNHSSYIESSAYYKVRVMQGINPFGFEWKLEAGESFETPQSVMVYSSCGMGGVSRELSDLYRDNLCRSDWAKKDRPILINNWEATYFDFTEEKLLAIAKRAKEAGVELFVLDDGWFGDRNNDDRSLGDWFVNYAKLPSGIDGLAKKINEIGLKFGLWFEPEMVNPDSDLYRANPDWAIHVPKRNPAQSRQQLVLDLTKEEVRDYVVKVVSDVLASGNVEYVKWDMNRAITDMPYAGYNHKYTLGYYDIMDRITSAFPNILFEGCSGGGGRFDAGVLYYMPQIWTSDNSDAVARLKIQYSTSMGYPVSSISAHVTAVPNHQNGRVTDLKTRADVAYAGVFGYELDITAMSDEEFEAVKEQIAFDKEIRTLMRTGDFYRLQNPYTGNYCAWEMVSKDKSEVFVMACKVQSWANSKNPDIKLTGIDEAAVYEEQFTKKLYGGDELMYKGFSPEYEIKDYATQILHLKKIK